MGMIMRIMTDYDDEYYDGEYGYDYDDNANDNNHPGRADHDG